MRPESQESKMTPYLKEMGHCQWILKLLMKIMHLYNRKALMNPVNKSYIGVLILVWA